jgi:hypothetical protein
VSLQWPSINEIVAPYRLEKIKWNAVVAQLKQKQLVDELPDLEYLVAQELFYSAWG